MNRDTEPRHLRPLDPRGDRWRWETLVRRTVTAAAPELARRAARAPADLLTVLSQWMRPALAAAAVLAIAAAMALALYGPSSAIEPGLAEALGYPEPVAAWIEGDEPPSADQVLLAMAGDQ